MTLNLKTPFPTFGGSTGGWLRAAEVEEKSDDLDTLRDGSGFGY